MDIELTKEDRAQAIASVERNFNEHFADELGTRLGNIQAGALLNFFLEEVGPCCLQPGDRRCARALVEAGVRA